MRLDKTMYLLRRLFYSIIGIFFNNYRVDFPIEKSKVQRILILRYDVLGDIVVSLPSFNLLRKNLSKAKICVLASDSNHIFLKGNDDVDEVVVFSSNLVQKFVLILKLRKKKFDVIINFVLNKTTKAGLIANFINPNAIKINIGHQNRNPLYYKLFNILVPLELVQNLHMADLLCKYVGLVFGIDYFDNLSENYKLKLPVDSKKKALEFIQNIPSKHLLFFNISAGEPERIWLKERYIELLHLLCKSYPKLGIIISSHPNDFYIISDILNEGIENVYFLYPVNSIWDVVSIINFCDVVFSPDTSIVHISHMLKKTTIVLAKPRRTNIKVWLPAKQSTNLILGYEEHFIDITAFQVFQTLAMVINKLNNFSCD